jgi:hypothetical protein
MSLLDKTHIPSPTRKYVALVSYDLKEIRCIGFTLPTLNDPYLEDNTIATASWYYLNKLDAEGVLVGMITREEYDNFKEVNK